MWIASTSLWLWRTRNVANRSWSTHDHSRKNGKNILMTGYPFITWILIRSSCAFESMRAIKVKMIHIWNGFFNHFSCYNKDQYRMRKKASIFNAIRWQHHDCLKIGFKDTTSVLEEVYVIYLMKPGAQVTNFDTQIVIKRYYYTRIFLIKSQCNCQWQQCKDKWTKQPSDEAKKVMKST